MSEYTYKTVAAPARAKFTEKASRFLGFVFPVRNEDEIKENINRLKKEYYDSSHVCYAFRLGNAGELYRANDAGEPSGTAGKPILGQIDSLHLTYVLVAVVRYFGGTKLGTGGLVQAYRECARMALHECTVVEQFITETLSLSCDYSKHAVLMKLIN